MTQEKNQTGGRFAAEKDKTLADFNSSFRFDRRLFRADISVNIAFCDALFNAGILTRLEAEKIKNGLQTILKRSEFDRNFFDEFRSADIHSFIEARLVRLIGDTGRKLQTGKSRKDQTVTTLRLWLRKEIEDLIGGVAELQKALIRSAEKFKPAVLPAYSGLKKAQPVLWAHWCLAFFEMFSRDLDRLDEVWRRVNVLTLGSGVGAGISFEIDREELARKLGFEGISANSLDGVGDRDFAVEFLASAALLMVHLSRLAEDLIIYSTNEFGFIKLDQTVGEAVQYQTSLELMRGKAGRVFGHQTALLTTLKGLPTAYNRDLQEDKEALFDTVDTLQKCLEVAGTVLADLRVDPEKTERAARHYFNAGELTDYLINRGISYGTAADSVRELFHYLRTEGKTPDQLSVEELRRFSGEFDEDVFSALSTQQILANKNQFGGTSPERVSEALEAAKKQFENNGL